MQQHIGRTLKEKTRRRMQQSTPPTVLPKTEMWKSYRLRRNDPILRSVVRLDHLSDFYVVVKGLWMERSKIAS
jgi:hypothetical protein